jgi:glycosyltransferase involved in cell wall biosynthesis
LIPLAFCIPGDIDLPTGGYRYDREVLKRLPGQGVEAAHLPLGAGFPHPSREQIDLAMTSLKGVDRRAVLLVDGLALGALPPEGMAALPHRLVALVHHPLGLEAGMPQERALFLLENEKRVLAHARHVIVTSQLTERTLQRDFGVPAGRIAVAEPGVAPAARAVGTLRPFRILAVGGISPRKAFAELVHALAENKDLVWQLTIAGSLELAPATVAELRSLIVATGMDERITLAGEVDDGTLAKLFNEADLFAMSSQYEGYGMALAEALARGIPIVTTTGGAADETVPSVAALKVPAGDREALARALRTAMTDEALRRRMADASWAAGGLLPTWDDTAREIADVIKAL